MSSPAEPRKTDWHGLDSDSDAGASDSEPEPSRTTTKRRKVARAPSASASEPENTDSEPEDVSDAELSSGDPSTSPAPKTFPKQPLPDGKRLRRSTKSADSNPKLTALTPDALATSTEKTAKTGVCYLSRVPPFMKPAKVQNLLSRFGPINRIFLAPEDPKSHARRVKYGGNKKRNFDEGWVEFASKRDAKLCAETLNATIIGGKKGNFYHDDIWNIKYLRKFKWHHLQAQISYENASRQAKMRAEIAKETKVNKTFLRNYERAKMVETMQEAKKRKRAEDGVPEKEEKVEVRRQWRQFKTKGSAAAEVPGVKKADKVQDIFSSVF